MYAPLPFTHHLSTYAEIEEFIGSHVSTTPAVGFAPLCGNNSSNGAKLYYKTSLGPHHIHNFNDSMVMGGSAVATEAMVRRFVGQQLMLLTELMTFCVHHYLKEGSSSKQRGAKRTEPDLFHLNFVKVKLPADSAAARAMALQFAKVARVCDV
jgi:hypothetical protein